MDDVINYDILSEQTKAEMALGRQLLEKNQARHAAAIFARDAEEAANKPPGEMSEADKAVAEARPLSEAVPVQEREPVFPVAGRKVKT